MPTKRSDSYAGLLVTERLGDVKEQGRESARRLKGLLTWTVGTGRKVPEGALHPERTRSGRLEEWQRLLEALQANRSDLEHLATQSQQLGILLSRAEDLLQSQAALEAGRKEATQRLVAILADCQRLATALRFSLKHHYGPTAEKLTDFGIQPVQGRRKKPAPAVE